MSGHSHYATIKRKKEVTDQKKGKLFSKMARAINIAIKTGGGADPEQNYKLRIAIDQAKASNMPKSNIDRLLNRAEDAGDIEEIVYEGFGPEGVGVIVDVATDNRNRTSQGIKNLFEKAGGSLAGPGAVSYNFEPKGLIVVEKNSEFEKQMLDLIDIGAEDVVEEGNELEIYITPNNLSVIRDQIKEKGYKIISVDLIKKPKSMITINDPQKASKVIAFLENLEDNEDVQSVHANLDVPEGILPNS